VAQKLSEISRTRESVTTLECGEDSEMSSEQDEVDAWQSASRLYMAVAGQ
jgi:hypothetical protein